MLLIDNARVIAPTAVWERGWLLIEGYKIGLMGQGSTPSFESVEKIDARGLTLMPGFIDVHVHGAMNCEAMDAAPDALRTMATFYAQHGVTGFLATTWTDSRERISAALQVVAQMLGAQPTGATILGAHLEGPYLNASKCGAQNIAHIRTAGREEAASFLDFNVIRLLSIAPEFQENHWLIEACVRRGITVSAAHTAATFAEMQHAVQMGLSHATHTYNAMTGLTHREPGTVGAVMTMPQVRCELIADNVHVHPAAMQILYTVKGQDGVILITDAVRSAGMPEGNYQIDERTVTVKEGAVRLPDDTLAGSILTMDRAVHNFMQAADLSLEEVWQCASLNAARSIGLADRKGSLEVGKDADLVLLDSNTAVYLTVAEGRVVYRNGV